MAKGKSSASSATRKKHARKAAAGTVGQVDDPQLPKEKKASKKEKKSKEPRKKVYIPPVKPAPVQPDPLDTLGIAQKLPPELLVILRRLAKKDSITKRRALEDFQSGWVEQARSAGPNSGLLEVIAETLPVWVSTRLSALACSTHAFDSYTTCQLFFFTHPGEYVFFLSDCTPPCFVCLQKSLNSSFSTCARSSPPTRPNTSSAHGSWPRTM